MIAALFALAATMIVAGVTAVVEGFPYVRLESGMAMVYGGSVVGSSGVLLLGLAVVAVFLKRVERAVRNGLTVAPAPSHAAAGPDTGADPLTDEFRLLATPTVTPAERTRIEPSISHLSAGEAPAFPPAPEPAPASPSLTLVQPPEERRPKSQPASAEPTVVEPGPSEVLPPAEPVRPGQSAAADLSALRPSLDPVAAPEAEDGERTVVGRYSSGGNTYVMFEDGTIEADTPNGRFTFASLDELRAFVDEGGEKTARGAA